jgi:glutathione S-transferase
MIQVHHLNNSRSHRVLWLLEELGLEYELVRYQRDPVTMAAPAELKAIHPLGKSPVLRDGDLTLAESGAIMEYLVGLYGDGQLRPPAGTQDGLRYLFRLHFAEGSAMPRLLLKLYLSRLGEAAAPAMLRVESQIAEQLAFMEGELDHAPYFAGKTFTAADIQMSFPLEAAAAHGNLDQCYPNLQSFLNRTQQRPAYRTAIERGGPYALAR